jgi:hypothetical protein
MSAEQLSPLHILHLSPLHILHLLKQHNYISIRSKNPQY